MTHATLAPADRPAPPAAGAPGAPVGSDDPAPVPAPAPPRRPGCSTARRLAALAALVVIAVAGAVGLAAAGGDGSGPAAVRTIELTAGNSRFTPATVDVAPGTTVRFVIRNLDPIDHEFIVGGPEVHQRHEVGREADHHGDVPGEVSVPAGATASTTWTAPESPGPVVFACHLPGHFSYGMAGVVTVTSS